MLGVYPQIQAGNATSYGANAEAICIYGQLAPTKVIILKKISP